MEDTKIIIRHVGTGDIDPFWNLLMEQVNFDKNLHPFLEFKITKCMILKDLGSWKDPNKYFDGFIATRQLKSCETSVIHGSNTVKTTTINEPVACVMMSKYYSFFDGRIIVFSHLVVTEKFRGHGIGLKMMRKLCELASEEDAVLEWFCSERNTTAVKFYKRLGSRIVYSTNFNVSDVSDQVHRFQLDRAAIKKCLNEIDT